jgi:DNA-binding CsgD family transcriptional regulator
VWASAAGRSGAIEAWLPGREHELDRIEQLVRFLGTGGPASSGPTFVVIRGEAGIGKTALWRAGLKAHRAAGHRVLAARPGEEELGGTLVALRDLFDDAAAEAGVLEPGIDPLDRGRAVLRTLRRLAAEAPVVVAIDDLQWCDPVSARALRHAFRRLDSEPVAVLATERSGEDGPSPPVEVVPRDRVAALPLGPLPPDAIRHVVAAEVGALPRPDLGRIHELSGGNPLYAIELARSAAVATDRLGAVAPATLRDALARRLAAACPAVLAVLRTAAALGPCPATTLVEACGGPPALVRSAIDDGLLSVGDDLLVRAAHPLLASVVLAGMNPLERQAVHARLAALVADRDRRARHLALSATGPDPTVAAELEAAAERAGQRGAPALAAELAAHAVRVSPPLPAEASARRALRCISYRAAAGETSRAMALTDELVEGLGPGPLRARAITQRVFLDFDHSADFLDRALADADAAGDAGLRGRVLELRGFVVGLYRGELGRGLALADEALGIARREADPELEILASGTVATTALLAGCPRPRLMDRALALAEDHACPPLGRWPQVLRARHCLWGGRLDEARRRFEALTTEFARSGVEFQRPYRLADRARLEVASGHLAEAVELGRDAREAALDAGNEQAAAWADYPVGLAHAHRGDAAAAEAAAARLRGWGEAHDNLPRLLTAHHVLGVVALAAGDGRAASAALVPAVELARRSGHRHPGYVPIVPDAVEATALAGDRDGCAALAAVLDGQAAALDEPWVDAAARRGRGLVALVAGDDGAAGLLGEAAGAFAALGYAVDAARTLLLQGGALRRAGRRQASADVLSQARTRFSAMGARSWLALVDAELGRVAPGRCRGELTPTEARIAGLVATGRRNREIAGELFVSVATVEAHLTRTYRKLGVRSRTELSGHVLAAGSGQV